MGLMALINIPVICILSRYAFRAIADYNKQRKLGLEPVFYAKNIGLNEDLDYWQEDETVVFDDAVSAE
jgi:AGCS family alanine or glycine:cation symporter